MFEKPEILKTLIVDDVDEHSARINTQIKAIEALTDNQKSEVKRRLLEKITWGLDPKVITEDE